ncbi:MAG TPA: retron system putative HNH endonuclease [Prolixibacteraceae bacterium]|nr:retron system putative HNH endonuclease [Prolixibacteraceae bacterium]
MRHIEKKPFTDFIDFVQRKKPINWSGLDNEIRTRTREYILVNEQYNQCAYTELPLEYEKHNSHIEHLKRKDGAFFPEYIFEWSNLFVSCNSSDFGGKYKDEVYLKGKTKLDNAHIINPALENPCDYFELTNWGELLIKENLGILEKQKADKTIQAFNLNHNSLKNRRKEVINSVNDYQNGGLGDEMISEFLNEVGFKSVIEYELSN